MVNGQIFNVGSEDNNYQLGKLAERISKVLPKQVRIDWYGCIMDLEGLNVR